MRNLALIAVFLTTVNSARILSFFYFPSKSHQYVFGQIVRELSLRGHQVTFITPNPLNDPRLTNLTEIDVSIGYDVWKTHDLSGLSTLDYNLVSIYKFLDDLNENIFKLEFTAEGLRNFLQKSHERFDLILVEPQSPVPFGLQHKFKSPVIAIASLNVFPDYHNLFGNTINPIIFPDIMADFEMPLASFADKIRSLYFTITGCLMHKYQIYPTADRIARKHFGIDMPYIRDIVSNASLLMVNQNPIFSLRRPNVPNVVEFFNVHMNGKQSLKEDLKKILDDAKEGVVYFSLGTNVRFDHVEGDMKKAILEALGDLPYTVICKWEAESVPGQPKNVHLRKWLPQQAVLAHSNVKLFVTQGGLQSSEEAIINAVPLVVIPFLGDQPLNAKILTSNGMAETISPKDLNKKILTETILKVAKDEKYRKKAKELRDIFLDQPQSGIDKVIWWCEYVIRHKGAKHLRSPAADIPLYEYFMLDVLALIIVTLSVMIYLLILWIRLIKWMICELPSKIKRD